MMNSMGEVGARVHQAMENLPVPQLAQALGSLAYARELIVNVAEGTEALEITSEHLNHAIDRIAMVNTLFGQAGEQINTYLAQAGLGTVEVPAIAAPETPRHDRLPAKHESSPADEIADYLFGNNKEQQSLVELTRETSIVGRPPDGEALRREQASENILAILRYAKGQGALEGIDDDALPYVATVVTQTILIWHRVLRHARRPSMFGDLTDSRINPERAMGRSDVLAVLAVAKAAADMQAAGYPVGEAEAGEFSRRSVGYQMGALIAKYGPAYTNALVNGDAIREHCARNGLDAEEWLAAFPVADRIHIALTDPNRLLVRAEQRVRGMQKKGAGADWPANREAYREYLFGAGYRYRDRYRDRLVPSFASQTTRARDPGGRLPRVSSVEAQLTTDRVKTILEVHNENARSEDTPAVLGILNEHLDYVATVTGRVIAIWQKGWSRRGAGYGLEPFPTLSSKHWRGANFARRDDQLVVEVASIVCELQQHGYYGTRSIQRTQLAGAITEFGPDYLKSWSRGDMLREYCGKRGIDATQFDGILTKERLATLLLNNRTNPVARLQGVVDTIHTDLTPDAIMAATGWTAKTVKAHFTPAHVARAAIRHRNGRDYVLRYAHRIDVVLSDENLSRQLKLGPKMIGELFPKSTRASIAQLFADPLKRAREHRDLAVKLMQDFGLTPRLAGFGAHKYYRSDPFYRAWRVQEEYGNRPHGVSDAVWAIAVFVCPKPEDRKRRSDMLVLLQTLMGSPYSLDAAPVERRRRGDTDADPQEVFANKQASDSLIALAAKAGVSEKALQDALSYIAFSGGVDENVQDIVDRLRRSAEG